MSLILQVKRPQRLDHWRAGQDHHWRGPYFRFFLRPHQQSQLEALERNLGGRALVRYAAAAFLSMARLYDYQRNLEVADKSTFVSPAVLTGHVLWSYAGPGTQGFANPEGAVTECDTRGTLLDRGRSSSVRTPIREHLIDLEAALEGDDRPALWIEQIVPRDRADDEDLRDALRAWAIVAETVAVTGSEWLVLDYTPQGGDS